MKRLVIIVLTLLTGVGVMSYPTLSNYLTQRNGSGAIQTYAETVADLDAATRAAQWAAAEEYNQTLTGQPVHDPFLEGTGMAMAENYRQVLNIDGIMGYLEIPRIRVYLPMYHGTSDAVLQTGLGHLEGSTLPIGGESRHAVISGHTGLSHAKLLTDLVELAEGDQFYVHVLGETLAYAVDKIAIVEPHDTDELRRFAGWDYVTLLTCTPYGVNSHRLLVRGERVPYEPAVRASIAPVASATDRMVMVAGGSTAGAMAALIAIVLAAKRRREYAVRPRRSW